jgi:hypothetical protein
MTSDNNPSRIPVSKHTANFIARNGTPHAHQGRQGSRSQPGEKRRRRSERGKPSGGGARKEWVVAALMGGVVVVAVLGLWIMGRMHSGGGKIEAAVSDRAESSSTSGKWHGPVPSVIAERFVEAKSQAERLGLVRNPSQVGPAMEAFFKNGPGSTERIKGFYPLVNGSSGDLVFESYSVEFDNAPPRRLSVSIDPQGAKVDFECYARFGSVTWEDLLGGKVTEAGELRVMLEPGSYYINEFSDEQKWLHFRATSPDLSETLDFYLDRNSPSVRDIQDSGATALRATLSVRAVNGSAKRRQFEITAVKALEWVEPG